MTRLVNEQTEVGLLLAVPGLLATLGLAPWLVQLFYNGEFRPAVGLLQWFVLGCLGRVISWPLGFVMLALNKSRLFFVVESLFNAVHQALIWMGLRMAGLGGVAMAFVGLYVFYSLVVYAICDQLICFRYSKSTLNIVGILLPVVVMGFVGARLLPIWPATALGLSTTAASSLFCMRALIHRIGSHHRLVRQVCKIPGLRWACGL
jgi:PST family polysaccharide transporter